MTIREAQADLRQFLDERGWFPTDTEERYYTMLHAMEELGELARVITHLESRRAKIQAQRNDVVLQHEDLILELGDVFCHVLKLAEAYGVSTEESFQRTMAKNRAKYPLDKFKDLNLE
ncbi:MAG: MazG-like family protein [Chloroflexota bacterium]|nr:hypothetical protein [Chloroflexota bacterium]